MTFGSKIVSVPSLGNVYTCAEGKTFGLPGGPCGPGAPLHTKRSVLVPDHSAIFSANPEAAFSIFTERGEAVALDARRVGLAEDRKTHSIKAGQAIHRREPKIAILRLHNVVDRILGQTIFSVPHIESL